MDRNNRVLGVVAVKYNLSDDPFIYFTHAFLTDPHGVIFLSSRSENVLKSLWLVDDTTLQRLRASRQFGDAPLTALMAKEPSDGEKVGFTGGTFYVSRNFVDRDRWSLLLFSSTRPIYEYRLFGIGITMLICVVVLVFSVASRQRGTCLESSPPLLSMMS